LRQTTHIALNGLSLIEHIDGKDKKKSTDIGSRSTKKAQIAKMKIN
jgi:hypothetical protein